MNIREFAAQAMQDAREQANTPTVTYGYQETGKPWQVIFRTRDGKDYCRETRPSGESETAVREWAMAQCVKHGLGSARVERW